MTFYIYELVINGTTKWLGVGAKRPGYDRIQAYSTKKLYSVIEAVKKEMDGAVAEPRVILQCSDWVSAVEKHAELSSQYPDGQLIYNPSIQPKKVADLTEDDAIKWISSIDTKVPKSKEDRYIVKKLRRKFNIGGHRDKSNARKRELRSAHWDINELKSAPVLDESKRIVHFDEEKLVVRDQPFPIIDGADIEFEVDFLSDYNGTATQSDLRSALEFELGEHVKLETIAKLIDRYGGEKHRQHSKVTGKMIRRTKVPDEEIMASAARCETKNEWKLYGKEQNARGEQSHYKVAARRQHKNPSDDIFDRATAHMRDGVRKGRITAEMCKFSSAEHSTITSWRRSDGSLMYNHSKRLGVFDECIAHMKRIDSPYRSERTIYALEFPDNHAYVGQTRCWERRSASHLIKGPAFKHSQKTGLSFTPRLVITGIKDGTEAANAEIKTIEEYRAAGWNMLNTAKGGSFGGTRVIWTKERCIKAFIEHKTKKALKASKDNGAFVAAKRNGWFAECSQYLTDRKTLMSVEDTREAFKKYAYREDVKRNEPNAWSSANKHGILESCVSHMAKRRLTPDECFASASKHSSRSKWFVADGKAYQTAKLYGIFEQCVAHMTRPFTPRVYSDDELFASAQPHTTKQSWRTADPNRWFAAFSRGKEFYEKCTLHMTRATKPANDSTSSTDSAEPQNSADSSATQLN